MGANDNDRKHNITINNDLKNTFYEQTILLCIASIMLPKTFDLTTCFRTKGATKRHLITQAYPHEQITLSVNEWIFQTLGLLSWNSKT